MNDVDNISLEPLLNQSSLGSGINKKLTVNAKIIDDSNNPIDSHQDADGGYHLGASIIQSIITSTKNSTTTNLASGATFTGTADETFGINGIQVFHASDQDCTIYIDQSIDDSFPVIMPTRS